MDKELGDNLSSKDFGMNNAYSFQFDENGNKKVVVTRQSYPEFDNSIDLSKEGLIRGVEHVNTSAYPIATTFAVIGFEPGALFFGGAGLVTDYILFTIDKKSGQSITRSAIIDSMTDSKNKKAKIAGGLLKVATDISEKVNTNISKKGN